jgi:syntaxin 5
VAKRKTLFDDRPVEISELTYIIKHDIAGINGQLSQLQTLHLASKAKPGAAKRDRAEEHRGNVVTLLQSRLAGATSAFQEVLEVRTKVRGAKVVSSCGTRLSSSTQNMKASRDRSEQFAFSGGAPAPGQNSGACLCRVVLPATASLMSLTPVSAARAQPADRLAALQAARRRAGGGREGSLRPGARGRRRV